jgi:hypothetical protein
VEATDDAFPDQHCLELVVVGGAVPATIMMCERSCEEVKNST